ncbi:hypothetical protein niasHS_006353 [Heterodera schachtii]|uniref:HAT C-terminal dimerisation domain-containing protein n=1 Tax=Heterodera schachtii TaxID=97005 RepID=A0ABD2JWK0_HETSC
MQFEREQRAAGSSSKPKRFRMAEDELVSVSLPTISAYDFEVLRNLCPVLKVFDAETQKLSREKSTASIVLPTLKRLHDFLLKEKFSFIIQPATSVSSERLFSKAGMIYGNKLRNRLSGAMAEKILLIKGNLGRLTLAPSTEPDEDDEELLTLDELEIMEY